MNEDKKPICLGGVSDKKWGDRQFHQGDRVYDSNGIATAIQANPVGGAADQTSLYLVKVRNTMKEVCGTCKHNKYSPDGNGIRNGKFYCANEESDEYGVPTMYDDLCDDWEEKD